MNRQTVARFESHDYYAYLNLDGSASVNDVKRNYKQLALQWHPDKHIGADRSRATDIFQKIVEAHETLTDASMRRTYDQIWGKMFRGRHRIVPEWARAAGRGRSSRPTSMDSCASLAGRGLSMERSSVERNTNVPSVTPQRSTQQKAASTPTAKAFATPEKQQQRSRPLSPPFLSSKRERTPSPPPQKKQSVYQDLSDGLGQQRAATGSTQTASGPGAAATSQQTPTKSEPLRRKASEKGAGSGSLRDMRKAAAALIAKTEQSHVDRREAEFQQAEKENHKKEALEKKAREETLFRRQLEEDHKKRWQDREDENPFEPPPRAMTTEEVHEQTEADREAFAALVSQLREARQRREERERLERQAEDEMDAALERERPKLASSEQRPAEPAPETSEAPKPKPTARPKDGKPVATPPPKGASVSDTRWRCADCDYLNSLTAMRCERCGHGWQAEAPCGNPEPTVQQPTRWQPYNDMVKAEKGENEELDGHSAISAWQVAGALGGGVAGLADLTAKSVQQSWSDAVTSIFSPFVRAAPRPTEPQQEWLCGRCSAPLRGSAANFCSRCSAIQAGR